MPETQDIISLTVEVVSAFVSQHNMRSEDVPAFIASTHAAIAALGAAPPQPMEAGPAPEHTGAVSSRKSLGSKDFIISMIDGKPYKTLKRHLSGHGLTPDQYRERYKLPASYPMVADNYSAARREMAKRIGLGRKPAPRVEAAPEPAAEQKAAAAPRKPRARKASAE